jgi:hypothetical protein
MQNKLQLGRMNERTKKKSNYYFPTLFMWTKEEGFTFGIMRKLSLFSASASASACEVFRSNICILFLRALVPVVRFLEKRYFVTWITFKEEKIKLGSKKSF